MTNRQVILVAGVGDLGKYACEELSKSSRFDVAVLSRGKDHPWCSLHQIPVYPTDYTQTSLTSIFNLTHATTVISFVNQIGDAYINIHTNLLAACQQSDTCKRLIPSEWIGDSETFPDHPNFYAVSRGPFRRTLAAQVEIEWTLFNVGWIADYLLPAGKTYMKQIPGKFPIEIDTGSALVRGTGDEPQSWVSGRDIGKAVVELCKASSWKTHTYVAGDWKTFNEVIELVESLKGKSISRTHRSKADIEATLAEFANEEELSEAGEAAQVDEMIILSCLSCPPKKTRRQRTQYFSNIQFSTLEELLRHAEVVDFV